MTDNTDLERNAGSRPTGDRDTTGTAPLVTLAADATPGEAAAPAAVGRWRHLQLLERVRGGSCGAIYRAWDENLQRQVALKLLGPEVAADPLRREAALREGRLLVGADDSHLIRVLGVAIDQQRIGIWMDFVEGTDLQSLVEDRGPLDAREAALLGTDLCSALAAVHAVGVVHRRVEAANVLKVPGGRTVLASCALDEGDPDDLPSHAAPELFEGLPATWQSDIYSLGALLFFLVTGEQPVPGRDAREARASHQTGRRQMLRDARPDLPADFVRIVERALARDPARRFRSAGELETALAATLGIRVARDERNAARRRARRRVRHGALATLITVAVMAAGAWILGPQREGDHPDGPLTAAVEFHGARDGVVRRLATGDLITPRDRLFIELQLSRPAHVYILNRDNTGAVTVIYPQDAEEPSDPLAAGRRHLLPGSAPGASLGWTFSADRGIEQFLIVASAARLALFEQELAKYPAVNVGGGLTVRPVAQLAMLALTRGIAGATAQAEAGPTGAPAGDVFRLARGLDAAGVPRDVWLREVRLVNEGG